MSLFFILKTSASSVVNHMLQVNCFCFKVFLLPIFPLRQTSLQENRAETKLKFHKQTKCSAQKLHHFLTNISAMAENPVLTRLKQRGTHNDNARTQTPSMAASFFAELLSSRRCGFESNFHIVMNTLQ